MEWDDLRYFLATIRSGSTAGAARAMGVRHTTVGRRIASLEAALGARLFLREASGMVPTETAAVLRPLAEEIERRMGEFARAAEGADARIEGVVKVTCSEAFSGYLFGRLPRLAEQHPGLGVDVLAGNRKFDIACGEADIAIRMVPTEEPRLVAQRLGEAGWSLYASEGYLARAARPETPAALKAHQVIGFDASMAGTPGGRWLAGHVAETGFAMTVNSVGALVRAIEAGAGIGMMPCLLEEGRPGLRRLFGDLVETRAIWLVFHPERAKLGRVRAVIDFLAETIRSDRVMLSGRGTDAGTT